MDSIAVCSAGSFNGEAVAWKAHIAKRCEGPEGRAEHKKKARRNGDAPSNKTYGNCLLGLHCSQKPPPGNRTVAAFPVVAGRQHQTYAQLIHNSVWISCGCLRRGPSLPALSRPDACKAALEGQDSIRSMNQSPVSGSRRSQIGSNPACRNRRASHAVSAEFPHYGKTRHQTRTPALSAPASAARYSPHRRAAPAGSRPWPCPAWQWPPGTA